MKCGSNKFCLGFEPDHKIYCYGSDGGCLWGQNTCDTDQDCSKYTTSSPKYTDGDTPDCTADLGWRKDACPDPYVAITDMREAEARFNASKNEYVALMDTLKTSCLGKDIPRECQRAAQLNDSMQTILVQMSNFLKTKGGSFPKQRDLLEFASQLEEDKNHLLTARMEHEDLTVIASMNHMHWFAWFISALTVFILIVYAWNKNK